ncbi:hypothetical protein T08_15299 [Trichinella sp. T8]|nr:hypothetical protein T08_15299 [Trichinella sp. T8]
MIFNAELITEHPQMPALEMCSSTEICVIRMKAILFQQQGTMLENNRIQDELR